MGGCWAGLEAFTPERAAQRVGRAAAYGRCHSHRSGARLCHHYDVEEVLGSGAGGDVFSVRHRGTRKRCALKRLKLPWGSQAQASAIAAEVETLLALDHPHVIRLVDSYVSRRQVDLVMECLEGGDLLARVLERAYLPEEEVAGLLRQVMLALSYLHGVGIAHCDLKLEQIMFESKGSSHIKIVDFGSSQRWDTQSATTQTFSNPRGTSAYMAPEVERGSYTSQCDLWSAGVVAFVLLTGYMPFSGPEERISRQQGRFKLKPEPWSRVSELGLSFVTSLLTVDPEARISAPQALEHAWLAQAEPAQETRSVVDVSTALRTFASAPPFRKACWSLASWSLAPDEQAALRGLFLEMDRTKTGTIGREELSTVLAEARVSAEEAEELLAALGGRVTYSEFLAAMCGCTHLSLGRDHARAVFSCFDRESAGQITDQGLLEMLGMGLSDVCAADPVAKKVFKRSGSISYHDFEAYFLTSSDNKRLRLVSVDSNCSSRASTDSDISTNISSEESNRDSDRE